MATIHTNLPEDRQGHHGEYVVGQTLKGFSNPGLELWFDVNYMAGLTDLDLILLDNMSIEECRAAVEIVSGRAKLEASGGLILSNAHAYAKTGVDYLAVGALTHSAPVLDIGLDLRME